VHFWQPASTIAHCKQINGAETDKLYPYVQELQIEADLQDRHPGIADKQSVQVLFKR